LRRAALRRSYRMQQVADRSCGFRLQLVNTARRIGGVP